MAETTTLDPGKLTTDTIAQARRLKIMNDWVKRALEELNRYKPQEYPLFKEIKSELTFEALMSPEAFGMPPADAPVTPGDEKPAGGAKPEGKP